MDSMTGYGQASAEGAGFRVLATLRGVNHRFLDLSLRLPEEARISEAVLQRRLGESLKRGRVELVAEIALLREPVLDLEINSPAAEALARAAEQLAEQGVASGELSMSDLLRMPDVVRVRATALGWTSEGEAVLLSAVDGALTQFLKSRAAEGRRLESVVRDKLVVLEDLAGRLETLRPEVQAAMEESFQERLSDLVGDREIDPDRVAQEVALLIDRSNVSEELERLRVHLEHLGEVLEHDGAVGKRLDFLVQEIFRELNTLSAKCRSSEMTRLCVDAKVLCEEMREQLRNVE